MGKRLSPVLCLFLALIGQGLWAQKLPKGEPWNLETAVLALDAGKVGVFLAQGASPDTNTLAIGANRQGTLLMYAASKGSLEIVTLLVEAGARIDTVDGYMMTALSFSVLSNDGGAVAAYLIGKGAKIAVPVFDSERRRSWPYAMAAYKGWLDLVELGLRNSDPELLRQLDEGLKRLSNEGKVQELETLLQHGAKPLWNLDVSDALVTAAASGRIDVIILLLQQGVPVDAANRSALTPLAAAVEAGKLEAARFLIAKGAHVNARDSQGQSVLDKAKAFDTSFPVDVLLAAGARGDLFDAIRLGDLAGVKSLATASSVNQRMKDSYIPDNGYTPLMAAVQEGRLEIVRVLVERGARIDEERRFHPDSGSKYSAGAFDLAIMDGKAEILRYLLSKGAKASGELLLLAAMNGRLECAKALVEKGADVRTTRPGPVWPTDEEGYGGADVLSAAIRRERDDPKARELVVYLRSKGAKLSSYALAAAIGANDLDLVRECLSQGVQADASGLVAACANEYLEVAKALLDRGVNPDELSSGGWTGLTIAASRGNLALVQALVEAGATVGLPNQRGERALELATDGSGDEYREIVNFLVATGPEPGAYRGRKELTAALLKSDLRRMESLLVAGASPDSRFFSEGQGQMSTYPPSLLDVAAVLGNRSMVELLVKKGASVEALGKGLDYAANAGRNDLVRLLLSVKAPDERVFSYNLERMIYIATQTGNAGLAAMAFELRKKAAHFDLDTPLCYAVMGGFPELVRILLDQGADPNKALPYPPQYGRTLLVLALERGKSETVRLLISRGARGEDLLGSGQTPLTALIRAGQGELALALLANGAKVETREKGGDTALLAAAEKGNLAVLKALIQGGGSIEVPGERGESPLIRALSLPEGQAAAAFLIRAGAQVGATGPRGYTAIDAALSSGNWSEETLGLLASAYAASPSASPLVDQRQRLFLALMKDELEAASALLAKGQVPISFTAWQGRTALMGLARNGSFEALKLVLEKGGDPTLEDQDGFSAYALALKSGRTEAARLLSSSFPSSTRAREGLLRQAALAGDTRLLASLLAEGIGAEEADSRGESALWLAAREGRTEAARLLLASKVSAETKRRFFSAQKGNWNLGPADIAGMRGSWELVDLLIGAGAKPDWLGILQLSTQAQGLELARHFVAQATPDYREKFQNFLIGGLAARGESEAVKYLLAHSADPVGDFTYTLAAGGLPSDLDYPGIASVLEKRGRGVWKPDYEDQLLPLAIRLGEPDILLALLNLGANPNFQDGEGNSLLRLAAQEGMPAMIELLIARGARDPLSPPQLVGLIEWK